MATRRKFIVISGASVASALAVSLLPTKKAHSSSVTPTYIRCWKSGDASFECSQTTCNADFSYKIDSWDSGGKDGDYDTDGGNTINIDNSSGGKTFDWSSNYPVCAVIVVTGGGSGSSDCPAGQKQQAYIYYYEGATSDTGLISPDDKVISHTTFCYGKPTICYQEETAWVAGTRYVNRGNWATYTKYPPASQLVDIFAGQTKKVGTATFSESGGQVTITINLTGGCIFYYDKLDQYSDNNIKVEGYTTKPPQVNPAPGLFSYKKAIEVDTSTASITVPATDSSGKPYLYYGIHLDVACPVTCPA